MIVELDVRKRHHMFEPNRTMRPTALTDVGIEQSLRAIGLARRVDRLHALGSGLFPTVVGVTDEPTLHFDDNEPLIR